MDRRWRPWVAGLLWVLAVPGVAQEPLDDIAADLLQRERIRSAVEAALQLYMRPAADGPEHIDNAIEAVLSLAPLGDQVVPYLANELEQERPDTFDFAAYALGWIGTPAAEAALRIAIERAEAVPGNWALARKAWAGWALGLAGVAEAVDLFNDGRHRAAYYAIHANCSVLESVALQTAPDSVPLLIGQLKRYSEDESMRLERRWPLRALRRIADTRSVPALVAVLQDPHRAARNEAAYALSGMRSPVAADALLRALDDEEASVRRTAAISLDKMRPGIEVGLFLKRLESETDPMARGAFYRLVAARGADAERARLYDSAGRDSPMDRRMFVEAVGPLGDRAALELLERSLTDPDNSVAIAAIGVLAELDTRAAQDRLLRGLSEASWTAVQVAAAEIAARRLARAAPLVTKRMLAAAEEADPPRIRNASIAADKLGRALIALRFTSAVPKLRKALPRIEDEATVRAFETTLRNLERMESNGKSVEAWIEQTTAAEPSLRRTAYERLVELGDEPAISALVAAFDVAENEDRVAILEVLADGDVPQLRALIERVLLDPEFDRSAKLPQRDAAAWAARRLGDEAMLRLLERAVERRDGQDVRVLIYAALARGEGGAELIRRYQAVRMRYLRRTRGVEQERLFWLQRYLETGRSTREFDVPPARLSFGS